MDHFNHYCPHNLQTLRADFIERVVVLMPRRIIHVDNVHRWNPQIQKRFVIVIL